MEVDFRFANFFIVASHPPPPPAVQVTFATKPRPGETPPEGGVVRWIRLESAGGGVGDSDGLAGVGPGARAVHAPTELDRVKHHEAGSARGDAEDTLASSPCSRGRGPGRGGHARRACGLGGLAGGECQGMQTLVGSLVWCAPSPVSRRAHLTWRGRPICSAIKDTIVLPPGFLRASRSATKCKSKSHLHPPPFGWGVSVSSVTSSDMIRWSRGLPSHRLDAARSY